MKRNYYIFSPGRLKRKDNTLYFEEFEEEQPEEITSEEENSASPDLEEAPRKLPRKPLPVEDIASIYCFGELNFNTKFLNFISQKNITLHFFNYYGYYTGSFYPREPFNSGKLLIKQAARHSNMKERMKLARLFVLGAANNIKKNLQYYNNRGKDLVPIIERTDTIIKKVKTAAEIHELMGYEGNIRADYYLAWNLIIDQEINFTKRSRRPPSNPVNALISFANGMVYSTVLSEIYSTQLNPVISFLHEPGTKRFSLSLDIAEIFKPLLADRLIFSLLNKNMLKENDFDKNLNYCYLKEKGRKVFLREYDEKLKTTIKHKTLRRSVSYRRLITLECYKIIKHILGEKEYKPFNIWW